MIRRTTVLPFLAVVALVAASRPAAAQWGCTAPESVELSITRDPIELAPGESREVNAHWWVSYRPAELVPRRCPMRWAVEPEGAGRLSRGRLYASPNARPGSKFIVKVRVGRRTARQTVHVVDPKPNPLAGYWIQPDSTSTTCTGGDGLSRPERIRELILRRDSAFHVTAVLFESRRDYSGRYVMDDATSSLRLLVESDHPVRRDGDLEGTARVEGNTLRLESFWLGDPRQERAGRTCTYVFNRQR
ncbi:MAG TPA: hypothetical protein VFS20_06055 [Longimicrobium sp.]|nr:hypothetical protein [Longimicrobium sp.]